MRILHVWALWVAITLCTASSPHSQFESAPRQLSNANDAVIIVSVPCNEERAYAAVCDCGVRARALAISVGDGGKGGCFLALRPSVLGKLGSVASEEAGDCSCLGGTGVENQPGEVLASVIAWLRSAGDLISRGCVVAPAPVQQPHHNAVSIITALLGDTESFGALSSRLSDHATQILAQAAADLSNCSSRAPSIAAASSASGGRLLLETSFLAAQRRSHQEALEPREASPLLLESGASSGLNRISHVSASGKESKRVPQSRKELGEKSFTVPATSLHSRPTRVSGFTDAAAAAAAASAATLSHDESRAAESAEVVHEHELELDPGWQAEIAMLKAVAQRVQSQRHAAASPVLASQPLQPRDPYDSPAKPPVGPSAASLTSPGSHLRSAASPATGASQSHPQRRRVRSSWISRASAAQAASPATSSNAGVAPSDSVGVGVGGGEGEGMGIGALLETQARAVLSTLTSELERPSSGRNGGPHSANSAVLDAGAGAAHLHGAAAAAASQLQAALPADADAFSSVFARLMLPKQRAAKARHADGKARHAARHEGEAGGSVRSPAQAAASGNHDPVSASGAPGSDLPSSSARLDAGVSRSSSDDVEAGSPLRGASALAMAGVHIMPDGTLRDDYTSSPSQRLAQLRARVAVDMFGPALAEKLLSQSQERDAQAIDTHSLSKTGSGNVTTSGHSTADPAIRAVADAAASAGSPLDLFLELQANAHARVIPFLKIILTPVINGVMKPVLKVAINMMAPALGENVQENIQARTVTQVPADVAKTVSNNGGPALGKSLADMLSGTLSKSLAASLTLRLGPRLRDSVTDAAVPRIATAVSRDVTATVIDRLTPKLVAGTAGLISRSLTAILSRSLPHALSSVLSASLNPLHMPPSTADAAALRQAQCRVCSAFRDGRPVGAGGAASALDADAAAKGGVGLTGRSAVPDFGSIPGSPLHGFAGGFPGLAFPGVAGGDRMPYGAGLDAAGVPWEAPLAAGPAAAAGVVPVAGAAALLEEAAFSSASSASKVRTAGAAHGSVGSGSGADAGASAGVASRTEAAAKSAAASGDAALHAHAAAAAAAAAGAASLESLIPASPAAPVSAFPGAGLGISESLACYLCEHGTAQERRVDAFVTQQVAHYHAEHYSRYYAGYYDRAHAAAVPPPKEGGK